MEKINDLLDDICSSLDGLEEKKRMNELSKQIEEDQVLQRLISDFQDMKEKYHEVSKYSTYHPDFKEVSLKLIELKEALYENETIKEYKELESKLSFMTLELNKRLKAIIPNAKKKCH